VHLPYKRHNSSEHGFPPRLQPQVSDTPTHEEMIVKLFKATLSSIAALAFVPAAFAQTAPATATPKRPRLRPLPPPQPLPPARFQR
jgi:hypothetical protein